MPTKSSTQDDPIEIAKWLNELADHFPQRYEACGALPQKLTDCELDALHEQDGDLQSLHEQRKAQKLLDERADVLQARGQLLNHVGVATGKRIVLAMQAGALSEYAELIRETMSTWANSHEDQLYNQVFLLFYNHVLPSRDRHSELQLRPDGLSTEAERYVRALRMLGELIQPAEAPPARAHGDAEAPQGSDASAEARAHNTVNRYQRLVLEAVRSKHPEHSTLDDITHKGRMGRTPATKNVNKLIGRGLLDRPDGERGGIALTPQGIELLEELDRVR